MVMSFAWGAESVDQFCLINPSANNTKSREVADRIASWVVLFTSFSIPQMDLSSSSCREDITRSEDGR